MLCVSSLPSLTYHPSSSNDSMLAVPVTVPYHLFLVNVFCACDVTCSRESVDLRFVLALILLYDTLVHMRL